jgi:hypothetical protein
MDAPGSFDTLAAIYKLHSIRFRNDMSGILTALRNSNLTQVITVFNPSTGSGDHVYLHT